MAQRARDSSTYYFCGIARRVRDRREGVEEAAGKRCGRNTEFDCATRGYVAPICAENQDPAAGLAADELEILTDTSVQKNCRHAGELRLIN